MSWSPEAKRGQVTGAVGPGRVGEVTLPFGGGTNTYFAYPFFEGDIISVGATVLVIRYEPPANVYVIDVASESMRKLE